MVGKKEHWQMDRKEITIQELCEKLYKKLKARTSLNRFYVGITNDIERRSIEHEKEGYTSTTPIATGESETIQKAEEYLLNYFAKSDLAEYSGNISQDSLGSKNSSIIYVSLFIQPKSENELFEDDLLWDEIYCIKQ